MDLNTKVSAFGSISDRGQEAVHYLQVNQQDFGYFTHNGIHIDVYANSTEREIYYQYELRRLQRVS